MRSRNAHGHRRVGCDRPGGGALQPLLLAGRAGTLDLHLHLHLPARTGLRDVVQARHAVDSVLAESRGPGVSQAPPINTFPQVRGGKRGGAGR